jgi:hypothetical protein
VANGHPIYTTEGEQDSENLRGLGIVATTNPAQGVPGSGGIVIPRPSPTPMW